MLLYRSYDTCDASGKPIYFSATSTRSCQVHNINSQNPYYAIYMGSSMSNCTAEGVPMTVGYLGPHCSTITTETVLSQKCTNKTFWDSNPLYQNVQYSCTRAKSKKRSFVGWIYTETYNSPGCTGRAVSAMSTVVSTPYLFTCRLSVDYNMRMLDFKGTPTHPLYSF
jgi:hypothetical protein